MSCEIILISLISVLASSDFLTQVEIFLVLDRMSDFW